MSWINEAKVTTAGDKLEAYRAQAIDRINATRDAALVGGFEYNGHVFDSDRTAMQRVTAAVVLGESTEWITKHNQVVDIAAGEIAAFGNAAAAHERQQVFKARHLKDAILSASTIAEIDAIVW